MPFDPGEFAFGWNHILQGAFARLTRQPRDKFVSDWQSKGVPMSVLLYQGQPQHCKFCGYVLAELALSEDWILHACSAIGFHNVLANDKHKVWLEKLTESQCSQERIAKRGLPTAGV